MRGLSLVELVEATARGASHAFEAAVQVAVDTRALVPVMGAVGWFIFRLAVRFIVDKAPTGFLFDLLLPPDSADEAVQYFSQFAGFDEQLPAMFRSEVTQVLGDHQLSLDLDQRSSGLRQEKEELVS